MGKPGRLPEWRAEWQRIRCDKGREHPEFIFATQHAMSVVDAATTGFPTDQIDAAESAWNDMYRTLLALKAIRVIATAHRLDPNADIVGFVGAFFADYQAAWERLVGLGIPSADDNATIAPRFAAAVGEAANQVKAVRKRLNESLKTLEAEMRRVRRCLKTSKADRPLDPSSGETAKSSREHLVAAQIIAILTDPGSHAAAKYVNAIQRHHGLEPIPWIPWNDSELAAGFAGLFGDEHPLSDADNVKALRFRLRHRSPNRLRHPTGIRARRT